MSILIAVLVITALGAVLGFLLAVADKKLATEKDEKFEALEAIMPGANCGGCGFAGCSAYAEAVSKGEAHIGLCPVGGGELARNMSTIMGVEAEGTPDKRIAYICCHGDVNHTQLKAKYSGMFDCVAASVLFDGNKGCSYGCLHMQSCAHACPEEAIYVDKLGNMMVDPDRCVGCGKCVKVCPHKVIKLIPYDADYVVACNSRDPGGKVRKVCEMGCIGCKICQNKFPESGCVVEENLSTIDYAKDCKDIVAAAAACPRKTIVKVRP